jgi:N-acetyl-S-(2-succino)cysteine monooxygenase
VAGLWDSWASDASIYDKASAQCFDPAKVRILNHAGKHFRVRGPLNVPRSPQGRPIVVQAGASGPGKALAARIADCVFTAQSKLADGKAFYDEIKSKAVELGRRPDQIRIMPGIVPILGRTDEEARELRSALLSNITDDQAMRSMYRVAGGLDLRQFPADGPFPELPLSNGAQGRQKLLIEMARRENLTLIQAGRRFAEGQAHHVVCGSAKTIADLMQAWFEQGACDGFALMPSYFPRGARDIAEGLVPELQRRGLFRTEYEGRTLRENLGLLQPKSQFDA